MTQAHTIEVLQSHGPDVALYFHLTSRCYPPAGYLAGAAAEAIRLYNDGQPDAEVTLPAGALYLGRPTAPARAIVDNFRLEAFIDIDD